MTKIFNWEVIIRKNVKCIMLVVLCGALLGITGAVYATPPAIFRFVDCNLMPTSEIIGGGIQEFKCDMSSDFSHLCSDRIEVTVKSSNYSETFYQESWNVVLGKGDTVVKILNLPIAENDTTNIQIKFSCGEFKSEHNRFFVTTSDTAKTWFGDPRHRFKSWTTLTEKERKQQFIDTLTTEQLDTKYEVTIDLRDPTHLRIAKDILGKLPEPIVFRSRSDHYTMRVSLRDLLKIGKNGIEFGFPTPPPWEEKRRRQNSIEKKKEKDTTDSRGLRIDQTGEGLYAVAKSCP